MKINKLLLLGVCLIMSSCNFNSNSNDSSSYTSSSEYEQNSNNSSLNSDNSNNELNQKGREDRNLSTEAIKPTNIVTEDKFIKSNDGYVYRELYDYYMKSESYYLKFNKTDNGYSVILMNIDNKVKMFSIEKPIKLYLKGGIGQIESTYSSIDIKEYGILASSTVSTTNGSEFLIEDRYYYPNNENVDSAINIQRAITVKKASSSDKGFQSIFSVETLDSNTNNLEWFVPNSVFGDFPEILLENQPYKIYRETLLGLPLAMVRNKTTGYRVSISRYQPVIDYDSNSYASISIHSGKTSGGSNKSSIEITYPTRDTSRRYFQVTENNKIVYDISLMAGNSSSYEDAMIETYTNQFTLQDQRIVNTDIDECYKVINEDFKTFMLSTTKNGYTSYGLPWRVTIENGKIGPKSYQAGFVGQQIPCAYNMMLYGIKNKDNESLQNGINIIDFWVNKAKMITSAGVPMIWYDGNNNKWSGYPTFIRMAVDAMEGLFDAYRLALANNINVSGWYEAVKSCADWMVKTQNEDGSWYRCYNYQGTRYLGTESDISWNPGDITRSTSKNNSTMPVRFLGKMYEFTNDNKYLNAIKAAGKFIYEELYPTHAYYGGTCDNPDCMDKEAGVYAMYAFDTLYTLTKEAKWLECLKQATIFTMSSVLTISFKIPTRVSSLKAAYSLQCGYTDGLSYICCSGTSLDNYAAYIYYELFRVYIYTGQKVYYDMAEFIQQNTKSTMDWDGKLNYSYKSLTPEASTIYTFGYSSAKDDDDVEGVWLPWQSAANAEPIAKMYDTFNYGDVKTFENTPVSQLLEILNQYGVGGNAHRKY